MKAKEKRKARAYKISDRPYARALRRAQKEGVPLATLLERVVECYADGATIASYYNNPQLASKIEIV